MRNGDSWRQQVAETIRTTDKLKNYISLSADEEAGIHEAEEEFRWHITLPL